jgi:hypothetical protein
MKQDFRITVDKERSLVNISVKNPRWKEVLLTCLQAVGDDGSVGQDDKTGLYPIFTCSFVSPTFFFFLLFS